MKRGCCLLSRLIYELNSIDGWGQNLLAVTFHDKFSIIKPKKSINSTRSCFDQIWTTVADTPVKMGGRVKTPRPMNTIARVPKDSPDMIAR